MPTVGNSKFPYNEKGMRDAQKYAEATGQEIKYDETFPGGFIMIDPETQMPLRSTMSKLKDSFGYGSYQEGGEVNKWTDDKGLFQGGIHKRLFGRSRDALQNLFGGGLKKRARRFAEKFDPESNKDVLKLQQMMNKLGITDSSGEALEEDAMLGNKTLSALRKLQGVEQEAPVQDTPVPEQSPIYDKPELSWTQGDNYLSQDFHKDTPMSFPRYQEGGSVDEGKIDLQEWRKKPWNDETDKPLIKQSIIWISQGFKPDEKPWYVPRSSWNEKRNWYLRKILGAAKEKEGFPEDMTLRDLGLTNEDLAGTNPEGMQEGGSVPRLTRGRDYPKKPDWYMTDARRPGGVPQNFQNVIDVNYFEDEIKTAPPQAYIKDNKLHIEMGKPPHSEDEYAEWLRGAELLDTYGWDDTAALFDEAGLSQKQSDIVYTIEGKPISKHKGLFGTNFLKSPGTDFVGGLPRRQRGGRVGKFGY